MERGQGTGRDPPGMADASLSAEVARFLYGEALMLDERRWDDWLALYAEDELPLWFEMSDLLGTDLIQVASTMFAVNPSTGETVATGDESRVVEDLRMLAEQGLAWGRRSSSGRTKYFAYEAMCFGAFVTTWQQAWRQVQLVDRPNFGLVLDTFQILGGSIVDPSLPGGLIDGWRSKLADELRELAQAFGGEHNEEARGKLFFCQLGDAQMPLDGSVLDRNSPLFDPKVHANPKMAWSRSFRMYASEGIMREASVPLSQLIFRDAKQGGIGYRGWVSAEYFNTDTGSDDPLYPFLSAERCSAGHEWTMEQL